MINRIQDFMQWMFRRERSVFLQMMFIFGCVTVALIVMMMSFLVSPIIAATIFLGICFGIPVVVYLRSKAHKEHDK